MFLALLFCWAPAPPPVVPGTPAHLVGSWAYSWGEQPDGRIVFGEAGWYVSRHAPRLRTEEDADGCTRVVEDGTFTHVGRWDWDGRTLVLTEWWITDGWQANPPQRYEVDFGTPRGYHLTGETPHKVRVVLSKIPPG